MSQQNRATPVQRFVVCPTNDATSFIQIDGNQTISLSGKSLEGQFQLPDGRFVLVMTEDCPYEETMTIHLLDREFQSIDRLEYGSSYESFIIESCEAIGATQLKIKTSHAGFTLSIAGERLASFLQSSAEKLLGRWVGQERFLVLTRCESKT